MKKLGGWVRWQVESGGLPLKPRLVRGGVVCIAHVRLREMKWDVLLGFV